VVTTFDEVHLGVAVATEAGLMVPVIHRAGGLSLADLAAAFLGAVRELIQTGA
jgi:pyruvate dehydrogenase E2 component (dihydrolipoamide acetyltransferase)